MKKVNFRNELLCMKPSPKRSELFEGDSKSRVGEWNKCGGCEVAIKKKERN